MTKNRYYLCWRQKVREKMTYDDDMEENISSTAEFQQEMIKLVRQNNKLLKSNQEVLETIANQSQQMQQQFTILLATMSDYLRKITVNTA